MYKIAIINQRYGLEVNGGSELYSRQIAERLKEFYDVEVLTSCALDYVTWKNHYKSGLEDINGIKVRRFPVDRQRNPKTFSALDTEMIQNSNISSDKAEKWIDEMGPYVPKLIEYVEKSYDDYDVFIIVTYLYYTAVRCIPKVAKKTIFIPTAHQEPYINFNLYKTVFESPKAYVFLTDEEKELVSGKFNISNTLYDVMGVGVDIPNVISEEDFKEKFNLDNYLIYVGRIDQGKDCPRMFEYFIEYKNRCDNDLKLVLMGKTVINIPKHPDIINLGFVSDKDKFNGIKASKALILPSKYESLSISVLEAMSLSKPVIVNGRCDVLKGHCIKSNGGLYYYNYFEFEGCINYLLSHDDDYNIMGNNSKKYIDNYFQWEKIMDKFNQLIGKVIKSF